MIAGTFVNAVLYGKLFTFNTQDSICRSKSADFSVRMVWCPLNYFLCLLGDPSPAVVLTESLAAPVGTVQAASRSSASTERCPAEQIGQICR